MFSIACNTGQQVPVTSAPTTAPPRSRPASIDGPLRVTKQSGDGSFLQDPATPLVVRFVAGDGPGTSVFLVEGDADLGAGETLIQETVELTVSSESAASFGFTAGPAEPKAEAPASPAAGRARR
jgi:hypothetical protein